MSLNWREINLVMGELSLDGAHIQQIVQPDFRNVYLQIYRPGEAFWLRICLETGKTRLHRSTSGASKPGKRQRFAQFLHARLKGGRITEARQINEDRIVLIRVERAGEWTSLWIRLWGGAANMIATDDRGIILDAFFRRPKRGEVSGEPFAPPVQPEAPTTAGRPDGSQFASRFDPARADVNAQVQSYYEEREQQQERAALVDAATRLLTRRRDRIERKLEESRSRLADAVSADRLQLYGDIIMANMHRISEGDSWLTGLDYTAEDAKITIPLDPARSPHANAQRYYTRAKKARRRIDALREEVTNLGARLEEAVRQLDSVAGAEPDGLRQLILQEQSADRRAAGQKTGRGRAPDAGEIPPGLQFQSEGFTILVGRNARENDALLRHHVRGNDLWLHTRDHPGGYVFVKSRQGKSVPLEVLLDAGNLAVHFSKARANGRAELYYTSVKYLRRSRNGPPGLVLPTQEKNLSVVVDQGRLQRLLT